MSSCEVYNCLLSLFAEMPGKDWYLTTSLTECGEWGILCLFMTNAADSGGACTQLRTARIMLVNIFMSRFDPV